MNLKNESGFITLDFAFSIVLVFAFSAILFVMSFSLSVVEIAQYFTFAAARTYFGAHTSPEEQKRLGEQKFKELRDSQVFGPLFRNGWFALSDVQLGDFNQEYSPDPSKDYDVAVGARSVFSAKILKLNFPLFGATFEDENGFTANINSYLTREPTDQECMDFNKKRLQAIKGLNNTPYGNSLVLENEYSLITDNGC